MRPYNQNKRSFDAIDLTGEDDAASSSQSRNAPPSQTQRDSWLEQDEHDADDIVISSQDGDDAVTQSYQLYSILDTKVVGVQYYKGHASIGEYVVVRREPSNPVNMPCFSNARRLLMVP